jgi:hypothetical protein
MRAEVRGQIAKVKLGPGSRHTIKPALFLLLPQEVSPLHSFYTTKAQFAVALIFPLPQSASSQEREMF